MSEPTLPTPAGEALFDPLGCLRVISRHFSKELAVLHGIPDEDLRMLRTACEHPLDPSQFTPIDRLVAAMLIEAITQTLTERAAREGGE